PGLLAGRAVGRSNLALASRLMPDFQGTLVGRGMARWASRD
ncbi:hypothetical protein A2U01_0056306, partial [Trifolium medium]|nr:hypothetical protein [Trifolium medium]